MTDMIISKILVAVDGSTPSLDADGKLSILLKNTERILTLYTLFRLTYGVQRICSIDLMFIVALCIRSVSAIAVFARAFAMLL